MLIHDVEQNSDEWLALRAGMPTASAFSKLITSTGQPSKSMPKLACDLAGELFAGHPLDTWNGNKYTECGHEIEEEARLAYELLTGNDVAQVGFITDDDRRYGCSPDGLVGDGGMVEIKCLPKEHIPTLLYWHKYKKTPPERIAQTQGQMMVAERQWCDLFFYRPELPSLVIRQVPDVRYVESLQQQLDACLAERDRVLQILREF